MEVRSTGPTTQATLISIVLSSSYNLLTNWTQNDCMLPLCGVAALRIHKRRVFPHNIHFYEVPQTHRVLGFTQAIQPPFAESQGTEVFLYCSKQLFGPSLS